MSVRNLIGQSVLSTALALGLGAGSALAASGSVDREDRILYINGDEWVDDCQVYVDGDEIEVELRVYDADGELDDVDTRDYDLDDIDLIIFQGFAGDDDFWNSTPIPCIAHGGAGDDVLLGGWADDELHGIFAVQQRVLAWRLMATTPTRIPEDIHIWSPKRQTLIELASHVVILSTTLGRGKIA